MAAIGQGGGGAGAPGGAPGGQPGAQPAGTPAGDQSQNTDPFGFGSALQNAPEHLRPMLQTEFDRLTPELQARVAPYEPLQPYMDRLSPLLQTEGDQPAVLDGLLELYAMTQDEGRTEDLADWWSQVGQEFGFFDDENSGTPGDNPAGDDAAGGAGLDPANPLSPIVQQLQEQLGQLTQRLDGQEQAQTQAQQVAQAQEQINQDLMKNLRAVGLMTPDEQLDLKSQTVQDVLALAIRYGGDEQAVPKAVADFVRLSGKGQAGQLGGDVADTSGVEALRAALEASGGGGGGDGLGGPQPALGRGDASAEPAPVMSWGDARQGAISRLRAGQ